MPAGRTKIHHLPATFASSRAEVENAITLADDFRVVLDDHNGVLIGLEMVQNLHETTAIARVQTNTRFIENVQGIDQRRPNRRGEVDPLHLAPRQRTRLAIERQIFQADVDQVLQPTDDLSEQQRDGPVVAIRLGQVAKKA